MSHEGTDDAPHGLFDNLDAMANEIWDQKKDPSFIATESMRLPMDKLADLAIAERRMSASLLPQMDTPTQSAPFAGQQGGQIYTFIQRSFTKATISPIPYSDFVYAFQLSMWDNIFGPKVEHLWLHQTNPEITKEYHTKLPKPWMLSDEIQMYIARHVLAGEIAMMDKIDPEIIDSKFHVFSDLDIIVHSHVFTATHMGSDTRFCISLHIPQIFTARYMDMKCIIHDRMNQISRMLKAIKSRPGPLLTGDYQTAILPVINNINHIFNSKISEVSLKDTLFAHQDIPQEEKLFLAKCITSLLQTQYNAVILGTNGVFVDKLIATLALFLNTRDRLVSSMHDKNRNFYIPDLHVQGIIVERDSRKQYAATLQSSGNQSPASATNSIQSEGGKLVSDEVLIRSTLPSTVIDLRTMSVRRTKLLNEYQQLRHDFILSEVEKFAPAKPPTGLISPPGSSISTPTLASLPPPSFGSDPLTTSSPDSNGFEPDKMPKKAHKDYDSRWTLQEGFLSEVKDISPRVDEFCQEIWRLPVQMRQPFVSFFTQSLHRVATYLVKFTEVERERHAARKTPSSVVPKLKEKIRAQLGIISDLDYNILLCVAERLQPGTYLMLNGDPAVLEERFLELFNSF
eukprot:TRINITY_DN9975_c0_g1_i1.p1 TRINITY_DN9975_c0_g1~~TRINITY_DN9975_c0_g1_i1.p1  ORF type:complete len:626 (+),score=101.92 TRINITY_DN9975_c0_g1_i1:83-1960(+)